MLGILIWNRAARPVVLALGVALHVTVGLNMELGFFSETMLVCYLAFLAPAAASVGILAVHDRLRALSARVRHQSRLPVVRLHRERDVGEAA